MISPAYSSSADWTVVMTFDGIVCHAHVRMACFLVKTHVHAEVDMAHLTTRSLPVEHHGFVFDSAWVT